jgi:hypothetical protein
MVMIAAIEVRWARVIPHDLVAPDTELLHAKVGNCDRFPAICHEEAILPHLHPRLSLRSQGRAGMMQRAGREKNPSSFARSYADRSPFEAAVQQVRT